MDLLRRVSRSFYLSIRLLPAGMHAPVALGYLLARATDSVADAPGLSQAERQALLQGIEQAFQTRATLSLNIPDTAGLPADEERLLQILPACLDALQQLSADDRADVQWVMGPITRGQHLDVARFGGELAALQDEDQVNEYTWLVAGCVGEFWTRLCARHLPHFAKAPEAQMHAWGQQYGQGLQRMNILRDTAADLALGRCYWPAKDLAALGMTAQGLARAVATHDHQALAALAPLYQQWLDTTSRQLHAGLQYCLALRPLRLRLASVLPALIAVLTLRQLQAQGPNALLHTTKIPRRAVRGLLLRLLLRGASPAAIQAEWDRATGANRSATILA